MSNRKGSGKNRGRPPRRRARPQPATPPSQAGPSPSSREQSVDVVGLLVAVILDHRFDRSGDPDAVIRTALRACARVGRPQQREAEGLFEELQAVASRDEVGPRQFQAAADQLLELSRQTPRESGSGSFLEYLSMLAG